MTNYFDQNAEPPEEDFKDQPDEIAGTEAAPVDVATAAPRPVRPTTATVQLPQAEEEYDEETYGGAEELDVSEILSDARLRLEQGRLYEMVLNHDIFDGVEADAKAIKNVIREIRAYAQERMEIMLGMRQEKVEQEPNTNAYEAFAQIFPFNSLEVEALKAIASTATKGASRDAAPLEIGPQAPPPRKTLNPIGKYAGTVKTTKPPAPRPLQNKPKTPVTRTRADAAIQRILEEEGVTLAEINEVFDPRKKYLTPEELGSLTAEQVIERNRLIKNKTVPSKSALPMPSPEQIEMAITTRAQQAALHPQMQTIMGLLEKMPPKKG
jgi:hypothetical protein